MGSRQTVRATITDAYECFQNDEEYVGFRASRRGGSNALIERGSAEERIMADCMENGSSLATATGLINKYLISMGARHVGRSSVHSAFHRLMPVISVIKPQKQGSNDPESAWAKARHGWCLQLLIRLRAIWGEMLIQALIAQTSGPYGAISSPESIEVLPLPSYFDLNYLDGLELTQVAWFDEMHREQAVGGKGHTAAGHRRQVRFRRNTDGTLNPDGSELAEETYALHFKYTKMSCFALGVAMVELDNGVIEGRRCDAYNYTGKWMHTEKDWRRKIEEEMKRVASLPGVGENHEWVDSGRLTGEIFLLDGVDRLPRGSILKGAGLMTVADTKAWVEKGAERITGIGGKTLEKLKTLVAGAKDLPVPIAEDHRLQPNPYKSRYGSRWESVMEERLGITSVFKLVKYMMLASEAVFKGTKHSKDWVFFHDALNQFKCKETVDWMKSKGYYKRWVKPERGLNDGTAFAGRPTGNTPELMPCDTHLFKDLHDSVGRAVAATSHLLDDDPRKLSLSTPHRQAEAYLKVWDPTCNGPNEGGVPGVRICEDVKKVVSSCLAIVDNKGTVVHGLGSRGGHRADAARSGDGVERRGGHREKGAAPDQQWLPPDIQQIQDEWMQKIAAKV